MLLCAYCHLDPVEDYRGTSKFCTVKCEQRAKREARKSRQDTGDTGAARRAA
jgi:hypothetical protein